MVCLLLRTGIVENEEKALKCLGGIESISKVPE